MNDVPKRKLRPKAKTPSIPRRGTKAAEGYFHSWRQINHFFHFVLYIVGHVDKAASGAHKVLVEVESDPAKRAVMEEEWKKRVSAADSLKKNRQFFVEIIFVRHVENYLNYLASLLYEVFTQRPETLRSSDTVEIARVLRHETIEALVRELAERKVESLSYSSFSDMSAYFEGRFKVTLASEAELKTVIEAIEIRNISVHNRCVINQRFATRTGASLEMLGKRREMYLQDLDRVVPLFANLVKRLDRELCKKLELKGIHFSKVTH